MLLGCHLLGDHPINCSMCQTASAEDSDHLFFICPLAVNCWHKLGIVCDLDLSLYDRILDAKSKSEWPFFMEVMVLALWNSWKMRNRLIFYGKPPSLQSWTLQFKNEVLLHSSYKETIRFSISSCLTML
ncbi:hypothetical protein BS78_09G078300 [Paspalum vaginatum]|nr:hypothetical protein BS78_09G078300 [Paspalum vaginatum]